MKPEENILISQIAIERIEQQSSYDSSLSHRHNYNEIFFFEKGGGKHMIDFVSHPIKDNSIHFVSSNKIHLIERSSHSHGYVLKLRNDFFQYEILKNNYFLLIEYEEINLSTELFSRQIKLVQEIETELQSNSNLNSELLSTIVSLILLHLKRHIKQSKEYANSLLTDHSTYKSFHHLLDKEIANHRTASYYAHELNLNYSKLNNELKNVTGKSIKTLIQDRLLLESKRLLFHSKLSNKEIAFQLNFSDSSHFSHFFKKSTGLSPMEYRKDYII
ncbi:MAG: AraC family transcriptional activator of pobA [Urechidicola sp.]|jgi:AraC family transcriptional activator of pobA